MDGRQIRAARERAGLTQQELGALVGVGQRTVGNWERGETVPRNRMARIQQVLLGAGENEHGDLLASASDLDLLAELTRRLARAKGQGDHRDHTAPTKLSVTGRNNPDGTKDVSVTRVRKAPPVRPDA